MLRRHLLGGAGVTGSIRVDKSKAKKDKIRTPRSGGVDDYRVYARSWLCSYSYLNGWTFGLPCLMI